MTTIADTDTLAPHESITPMPTFLSAQEAADYLGMPLATLYTWRTRRRGYGPPAHRRGRALRYRVSDLDAWIEAHLETIEEPEPWESQRGRATASMTRLRGRAPGLRQAS